MRAVLLAGGLGTRLHSLTGGSNKHLMNIGSLPMFVHALRNLESAGFEEAIVVVDPASEQRFIDLIGLYRFRFRKLSIWVQPEPDGILGAVRMLDAVLWAEPFALLLADNVFSYFPIKETRRFFKSPKGARIFLTQTERPSRFAVATLKGRSITDIVEKPSNPQSCMAVVGYYLFDGTAILRQMGAEHSERGELEIVSLLTNYLNSKELFYHGFLGDWVDAGSSPEDFAAAADILL